MRVFIDTNIFLDLILKREKYKEALEIFNSIDKGLFVGYILDITILNIDYIAKKQTQDVREFLNIINKLFCVVSGSNTSIEKALKIENNDLEDNLQYISAKESKCKIIITNDKKFYKNNIKLMTSEEFCENELKYN